MTICHHAVKTYYRTITIFYLAITIYSRTTSQDYALALHDADACVAMKPDFGKGYGRQGDIYFAMGQP